MDDFGRIGRIGQGDQYLHRGSTRAGSCGKPESGERAEAQPQAPGYRATTSSGSDRSRSLSQWLFQRSPPEHSYWWAASSPAHCSGAEGRDQQDHRNDARGALS